MSSVPISVSMPVRVVPVGADSVASAAAGAVGRVCFKGPFGMCCVQFEQGCLRVHESRLLSAVGSPAPSCSVSCSQGNIGG